MFRLISGNEDSLQARVCGESVYITLSNSGPYKLR